MTPYRARTLSQIALELELIAQRHRRTGPTPETEVIAGAASSLREIAQALSDAYIKLPRSVPRDVADVIINSVYGELHDELLYAPEGTQP